MSLEILDIISEDSTSKDSSLNERLSLKAREKLTTSVMFSLCVPSSSPSQLVNTKPPVAQADSQ